MHSVGAKTHGETNREKSPAKERAKCEIWHSDENLGGSTELT